MAIITPALISALKTSFQKHFQDALATAPSTYLQVATVIPSTTASNTYGWLGQFPAARVDRSACHQATWRPRATRSPTSSSNRPWA
ncbi:Mu-like prophage major head subunit gpT family protein [Pseudomonas aeruginosa]|nr:Mu-like prophage major head subunit gpT family protein [Pseudomonas aeruginosa]